MPARAARDAAFAAVVVPPGSERDVESLALRPVLQSHRPTQAAAPPAGAAKPGWLSWRTVTGSAWLLAGAAGSSLRQVGTLVAAPAIWLTGAYATAGGQKLRVEEMIQGTLDGRGGATLTRDGEPLDSFGEGRSAELRIGGKAEPTVRAFFGIGAEDLGPYAARLAAISLTAMALGSLLERRGLGALKKRLAADLQASLTVDADGRVVGLSHQRWASTLRITGQAVGWAGAACAYAGGVLLTMRTLVDAAALQRTQGDNFDFGWRGTVDLVGGYSPQPVDSWVPPQGRGHEPDVGRWSVHWAADADAVYEASFRAFAAPGTSLLTSAPLPTLATEMMVLGAVASVSGNALAHAGRLREFHNQVVETIAWVEARIRARPAVAAGADGDAALVHALGKQLEVALDRARPRSDGGDPSAAAGSSSGTVGGCEPPRDGAGAWGLG